MIPSLVVWCFASAFAHHVHSQAVQASPGQNVYSLASFDQNQATDLTPACNDVYTTVIPGCSAPDFLPTNACSASCINGLSDIQTEAQAACADSVAPPNSMLMFFSMGNGVQEMCTVQKSLSNAFQAPAAAPTTLVTAVAPTSPSAATSTISGAQLASQAGAGQTSTALSQGAIIGIVVAAVVFVALMAVMLSCLRWKKYSGG